MTATVETVSEQLDLAAIMPTEKIMSAVARTVTLSETDVGNNASYNILLYDIAFILKKPLISLLIILTLFVTIMQKNTIMMSFIPLATATVSVAKPHLIGENDEPVNLSPEIDSEDFWHTSVGKFRFTIEELPEQLQYIHKLLKVIRII